MDETKPINRRGLLSGSFALGLFGGTAVGAVGMKIGEKLFDSYYNERLAKLSYAQFGEDLVMMSVCQWIGLLTPEGGSKLTYLDIGANDPIDGNNTYLFYKKFGSRGVTVEPNVAHCRNLEGVRPGDKVLNVGIGPKEESEADYYLIGGPNGDAMNTFDKEIAENYKAKTGGQNYIEKVIKMPLVNINRVIQENLGKAPNILSIDAEGFDLKILQSLDFTKYRPDIICAETLEFGAKAMEKEIFELMAAKDYVVRGGSFVNTVFVDRVRQQD